MLRVKNEICYQKSPKDQEIASTENVSLIILNNEANTLMFLGIVFIESRVITNTC